MEAFARIFSSSTASNFPTPLRTQLLASSPRHFSENLYASYILRTPDEYIHNSSRASIAITAAYRLVVISAGKKQIDLPLRDPRWTGGLKVWMEKGKRVHFWVDLGFYNPARKGEDLEIRVETENAREIVGLVEEGRRLGKEELPAYIEGVIGVKGGLEKAVVGRI